MSRLNSSRNKPLDVSPLAGLGAQWSSPDAIEGRASGRKREWAHRTPPRDKHVPRTSVQSRWVEPGACIAADRQNSTKAFMAAETWRWRG